MEVLEKIPVTLEERLEYGEELRIPASWEEFLDLLEKCHYPIQYDEHEIISFMGFATLNHERLIPKLGCLIDNLLDEDEFGTYGSNLALHIPGFVRRHYNNADCVTVKGDVKDVILRAA